MYGTRAMQQPAAMTVKIVDLLYRLRDPVDRAFGKLERKAAASARCETGNAVQHCFHMRCPVGCLMIINKVPRAGRTVDHFAQAHAKGLLIFVRCCSGRIEFAEQRRIPLDQIHDHLDQYILTLFLQMIADAGKGAGPVRLVGAQVVRRQRGGHHMLAEAPILPGGTGALAVNILPLPFEFRPVVFRARHLRQHAPRLNGQNLDLAVTIIGLAARKHFLARKLAQDVDVEAGSVLGCHTSGRSNGSVSIRCSASSRIASPYSSSWPCSCFRQPRRGFAPLLRSTLLSSRGKRGARS